MARRPTLKQRKVAKLLSENIGMPIGQAMREAGYSQSTSETPGSLTKTETWQQLLERMVPDSKISQVLQEGLEANRVISAINTGKEASGATTDFIEVPDHAIRHKFLETAAKMKAKFPASEHKVDTTIEVVIKDYADTDKPTTEAEGSDKTI